MKLITEHPTVTIDELETVVSQHDVRTSPHVGNLNQQTNPHYIALAMAGVRLEMVDTIMSNDKSGQPLEKIQDGVYKRLSQVGQSKAKKRTPSSIMTDQEPSQSLTDVHLKPLRQLNPSTMTSSEYFASVGQDIYGKGGVYQAVIQSTSTLLRLARDGVVSSDHGKRKVGIGAKTLGVYGVEDASDRLSGLMPSLEAMMAIEVVDVCLTGEQEVHHIGGKDMTEYTKDEFLMQKVNTLAHKALELLGCLPPQSVRYVVYDKNRGVKGLHEVSHALGSAIGVPNFSQHDIIVPVDKRIQVVEQGKLLV